MSQKRLFLPVVFSLAVLFALWRTSSDLNADPSAEPARYEQARRVMRDLLDRYPGLVPDRARVRDSLGQLQMAAASASSPAAENAMARVVSALEMSDALERMALDNAPRTFAVRRRWPSGAGVLVLRLTQPGPEADRVPEFLSRDIDGPAPSPVRLDLPAARTVYAALAFEDLAPGSHQIALSLRRGEAEAAKVEIGIEVPKAARLRVIPTDSATGQPAAAVAGLYSRDGQIMTPDSALSFEQAGFRYHEEGFRQKRGRARPNLQSHYWPGTPEQRKVFFVDGGFTIDVPEGDYTLIAGKGFEYAPVARTLRLLADSPREERVPLERWIDMPAKGWYSGDGHVHYARESQEANRRLMLWARAEDVHVANVLRMGDALETYFEQYAYGTTGRYQAGDYALAPGQEDPRTTVMGHTLHLNLQAPVRKTGEYYLYHLVFDEVRKQGGLTGYAHVYQPAAMGFFVRQDMTLNVPAGKIDFAEISEFGDIDTQLYYEFLNLGFPLTASAGSDVPWGNTIGTSRVYAYTGANFDLDAWFRAVKDGHTFVTTGPMLELTVNGQIPGSEIRAQPGDMLRVKAIAQGKMVLPRYLEIVIHGDVAASAPQSDGQQDLTVEFSTPASRSLWIAARCAGAQTTPVYVRVGDQPFWKLEKVRELVDIRASQLDDILKLIDRGVPAGRQGTWNGPESFQRSAPGLRKRVEAVRAIYDDLRRRAERARP